MNGKKFQAKLKVATTQKTRTIIKNECVKEIYNIKSFFCQKMTFKKKCFDKTLKNKIK